MATVDERKYRRIRADKIITTLAALQKRIARQFENSGLSRVADELAKVADDAVARAERIREPDRRVRLGWVVVGLLAAAGLVYHFVSSPNVGAALKDITDFFDRMKVVIASLLGAIVWLVYVETWLKRQNALKAVHELRSMAHIIDMHQLTKAPERVGREGGPTMEDGATTRLMTPEEVGLYLNFCTELLAILSKIGHLYVQDFPDPAANAAVDHFEELATGLTSKIWQKLMILDRMYPRMVGER